jgi:CO/xanthine dehydrogenase FAD-binding subunit
MAAPLSHVFYPSSFQELFSIWKDYGSSKQSGDTTLCAGGIGLLSYPSSLIPALPGNIISLEKIPELRKISRTERYIEIGCMVKLSQIINLGKIVPEGLTRCLRLIADPQLRNQATIGGNLCYPSRRLDASAPMVALDAQYELRTIQTARWIPASRFSSLPGPPNLGAKELLTRIRVPLEPWSFTRYSKFNITGSSEIGGGILFLMRIEKDILSDIRIVYAGKAILRDKNSESMLSGRHLPIDRKDANSVVDSWKDYLHSLEGEENTIFPGEHTSFKPELIKIRILQFIESTLIHISD